MKTVLIKSRFIARTLFVSFCLINFSCTYNKTINIKNIDNKTISFGTTINKQLFLTLNEYIVTEDSILLILESKFHDDNISRKLVLPNSFGGYGMGSGFNDSFDFENLIHQNFERKNKFDFIIVQHLSNKLSNFYYFKIENTKIIILDRIFTIFRYSNNYGVEPENIEINCYIINENISNIDSTQYNNITKIIGDENYNNQWKYTVKPNSKEFERVNL